MLPGPHCGDWLDLYQPLYGVAATSELFRCQRQFSASLPGHPESNGELYRRLIPRAARHALGEYYTPAWLAEFVLDRLDYRGQGTLLDPSAGFGVFLGAARARGARFDSTVGYELNPLTADAARASGLNVETRDTLRDPGTRRFDFIAGNPPWVNWRYLVPQYRERIAHLWTAYKLGPQPGLSSRLGSGMDDISVLFTCLCAHRLLTPGGRMGLLLSKSLLQSAGGARQFRRFELPEGGYLKVLAVHEIAERLPFAGTANQTVAVLFETSESRTVFPVPYHRGAEQWEARPVLDDPLSPWAISRAGMSRRFDSMRGASAYSPRVGIHTGGATGVYWVDIVERRVDSVVIRNRHTAGRSQCPAVTAEVEPDLLRTLVRGRDLSRWTVRPSCHILLPHSTDGRPIPEPVLRERYPRTFAYFERFRDRMLTRPHYRQHFERAGQPYWSMYNVGPYTFAPHRAVWREQSTTFQCAAIHDPTLVADSKLVIVPCNSQEEAAYLTALLNSTLAREFLESFLLPVQKSTHALRHLKIPTYDPNNPIHNQLATSPPEESDPLAEECLVISD